MKKKPSGVPDSASRVKAEGLESVIKAEPETFQLVSTEIHPRRSQRRATQVIKTEEIPNLSDEDKRNLERLDIPNHEISYGQLESEFKPELPEFYYPIPTVKPRRVLKPKRTKLLKPLTKRRRKKPRRLPLLNHKGKHYICDYCGRVFKNRSSIYIHTKYKHLMTIDKFSCDLCPRSFKMKYHLRIHMKRHLKIRTVKFFLCDDCGYSTRFKATFKTHRLIHQKTKCPICNKLVAEMKKHMLSVHKLFPCRFCGKEMNERSLAAHVRSSHEKHIHCTHENCSEAFGTRIQLRYRVLRAHTDGEVFECHCGAVLKTKNSFYHHQSEYHQSEKSNICKICDHSFETRGSLLRHWNKMHLAYHGRFPRLNEKGTKLKNQNLTVLFCDHCPKSFTCRQRLWAHLFSHFKFRKHVCDVCGFSTNFMNRLKIHKTSHEEKKECPICHKFVRQMEDHMINNHQEFSCKICSKIMNKNSLSRHRLNGCPTES